MRLSAAQSTERGARNMGLSRQIARVFRPAMALQANAAGEFEGQVAEIRRAQGLQRARGNVKTLADTRIILPQGARPATPRSRAQRRAARRCAGAPLQVRATRGAGPRKHVCTALLPPQRPRPHRIAPAGSSRLTVHARCPPPAGLTTTAAAAAAASQQTAAVAPPAKLVRGAGSTDDNR